VCIYYALSLSLGTSQGTAQGTAQQSEQSVNNDSFTAKILRLHGPISATRWWSPFIIFVVCANLLGMTLEALHVKNPGTFLFTLYCMHAVCVCVCVCLCV